MDLRSYAARIAPLDNYGKPDALMFYALGMCGEVAELFRACLRGGADAVVAECGDVCWYATRLFSAIKTHAGMDESDLAIAALCAPLHPPYDSSEPIQVAVFAAGDVAEAVKKTYRDCDGRLSDAGVSRMLSGVKAVLHAINKIGARHNTPLRYILDANIEKLESRRRRGCLAGGGAMLNGDER